ncbi:MAG TPA: DUF4162 domain-containing protein, partial [Kofleriaceae bacterium]|nr:DUF4162 domain-containing protein [Kofleriaceae bacterium]
GDLQDIKRREAAEGLVALGFSDAAARAAAQPLLADRTLVAETRAPRSPDMAGEVAGCEVKLAEGVAPPRLLSALVAAGVSVRRFEVVVPTLHQIFVDRVGASATVAERRPEVP